MSKPLLFSFLLKKQDNHTQVPRFWRNSRGKKTEDVLVLWKLSSLFDESNYHGRAKNSATVKTTLTIVMKTTHRSRTIQTEPSNTQQQPSATKYKKPGPQNTKYNTKVD